MSFREKLWQATEWGILWAVRVGLLAGLVWLGLTYATGIVTDARLGREAYRAIELYISRGVLPKPQTVIATPAKEP